MAGEWKTVKMQLDSQAIRLLKQTSKYFCGVIALNYFVENCLDFTLQYLRNASISKVLVILFPKINQFTNTSIYLFTNTSTHT